LNLGPRKISLVAELAEVVMAAKRKRTEQAGPSKSAVVDRLAEAVRREVRAKLGANSTFEQRRDAAAELMREVLSPPASGGPTFSGIAGTQGPTR
jgi:hypothetical protein